MSKAPSDSKKEEAFQISQFLKMLGIAESDYLFTSHDPPDAVIIRNKHKISLEHMRFLAEKEREQESIRRVCVSRAKARFLSTSRNTAISANVLFDDSANITNDMIDRYASSICEGVLHFIDCLGDVRSRHEYGDVTLYLSVVQNPVHARWQCVNNSIGWVKKIRKEALANRLAKKEAGLEEYRDEYDESWLLIFIDKTKGSSMYTLSETRVHTTMFDKVFVSTDQEYIELRRATTARAPKEND